MKQIPDKNSFIIILWSDEIYESQLRWQTQCEDLYLQLHRLLLKCTVTFYTPSDLSWKAVVYGSLHFIESSTHIILINPIKDINDVIGLFIVIIYIIHEWYVHTPNANVEIISPYGHIKFNDIDWQQFQKYIDEKRDQRDEIEIVRKCEEDRIRIKKEYFDQFDKITIEALIRKFPGDIVGSEYSGRDTTENSNQHQTPETAINNFSEEINKILNEEFNRLSTGQITFKIANKIKTGVSEIAQANIAKTLSQIIEKVKDYGLHEEIKLSPSMRVSLKGESSIFDIQAITKEVQLITDDEVTTWEWTVKPLKSGEQTLFLSVDVILKYLNVR